MSAKNRSTRPTTVVAIMSEFGLGVADARARRGDHPAYESWTAKEQWNYERGRQWATLAPRSVELKRAGKVTAEAVRWYGSGIL